jgi:hypothetical protein
MLPYVEHLVPGRLVEVLDQPVLANTGAVDQHVEAAEALDRRADDGLANRRRGDVAGRS